MVNLKFWRKPKLMIWVIPPNHPRKKMRVWIIFLLYISCNIYIYMLSELIPILSSHYIHPIRWHRMVCTLPQTAIGVENLRVRVVTYATTYNITPPHGTQLTPQPDELVPTSKNDMYIMDFPTAHRLRHKKTTAAQVTTLTQYQFSYRVSPWIFPHLSLCLP